MGTSYSHVKIEQHGPVLWVALNRPEVRNAFNQTMIAELTTLFSGADAGGDATAESPLDTAHVRAVVLGGTGDMFSAGADLSWMQEAAGYSRYDNEVDAQRLASMFDAIEGCAVPVIARVNGAALGGGVGLVAACDIAIAAEGTIFGFTEARLGIAPAVISPYVLRAIGPRQARALFITGERFGAERAERIGLVHRVVPAAELDEAVQQALSGILECGPAAIRACKRLTAEVPLMGRREARTFTVETIAALRASDEGREGMAAFLEKRKPSFATS